MHRLLESLINELNQGKALRADGPANVQDQRLSAEGLARRFDQYVKIFENVDLGDGVRCDANEAATLARQLLAINAKEVNQLFTKLKANLFIPIDGSIPTGASSYTTQVFGQVGSAKIVTNYANDFPTSETSMTEVLKPLRSIGNGYFYTIQDLRAAAMSGRPIEQRRATNARMVHDRTIEQIAAKGDATHGLPGFLTNSDVDALAAGSELVGGWDSADPDEIYSDLGIIVSTVTTQSQDLFEGNTLVLPLEAYEIASKTPYSTLNGESVLSVWMKSNPHIKNVDSWAQCDNKDDLISNSSKTRAVCYDRNPMVLDQKVSQAFEQFAPQQEHMQFNVDCHSRHGGTMIYYPLGVIYADGLVSVPSA